jgi:hypothetical protein
MSKSHWKNSLGEGGGWEGGAGAGAEAGVGTSSRCQVDHRGGGGGQGWVGWTDRRRAGRDAGAQQQA